MVALDVYRLKIPLKVGLQSNIIIKSSASGKIIRPAKKMAFLITIEKSNALKD